MKVRIGISDTDKVIQIDIDDAKAFKKEIERSVQGGDLAWFTDSKGRSVGIPAGHVAFIEMDDPNEQARVGFGPVV